MNPIKQTIKVFAKSFFISLLIILMDALVFSNNGTTYIAIFLQEKALGILSIMYPIIVSSFLSLRIFSVQAQTRMIDKKYTIEEQDKAQKAFDSYTIVDKALFRIVKVLFWVFVVFLGIHFLLNLTKGIIGGTCEIFFRYTMYTIQLTIFVSFFYGLYQMVITAMDTLIAHK